MNKPDLKHDWYPQPLPDNMVFGKNVYIDSSYGFRRFQSRRTPALIMDDSSGLYQFNWSIMAGINAMVRVGGYTCLNSCTVISDESVYIGSYCLVAWGVIITDSLVPRAEDVESRGRTLLDIARDPDRRSRSLNQTAPVVIEDNVWIGFGSVVCGGVRIGRGAIIGCKTVVTTDVPPYAVMAGNPPRIIRFLEPDDTESCRVEALRTFGLE